MALWQSIAHESVIDDWTQKRPVDTKLTAHQLDVHDLADTLYTPPTNIDSDYLQRCSHAAQLLGIDVPSSDPQKSSDGTKPLLVPSYWSWLYPQGNPLEPWMSLDHDTDGNASISIRNLALSSRNAVFEIAAEINAFVSRASNAGFAPPENPFSAIATLNAGRNAQNPIVVTVDRADQLMSDISQYLALLQSEKDGKLNLNSNIESTAQLSSVSLSFDGFGGSGQSSTDVMKFLPDMDLLSEQKARDALAVLDFRKRIPKVMFTANYSPHGDSKGCLIGWKKMPDAAGYVLTRRNVFDGNVVQFTLTSDQLDTLKVQLDDYVKTWVLSFYDKVDPSNVYTYLDSTITSDSYYIYTLQAYQLQDDGKITVFTVDTSPANLSGQQRLSVQNQLADLGPDPSVLSPYPVLAQALLGDSTYDWILAGVNTRAAITRNETRTTVRKYSYLTADLQFVYSQMDAGKFVVPKNGDIQTIVKSITSKLSRFGVSQVLYELMQETGILFFFEGVDAGHDPAFSKLGSQDPQSSNLLSILVASIDPETLIMDLRSLATNLPKLLAGGLLQSNSVLQPGGGAREIELPDPNTASDQGEEIQFLTRLGSLDDNHADLTTFEGLSKFIRVIRIFSDYGTNRAQATIAGKPPAPPPPPAPKPTSDQQAQQAKETPAQQAQDKKNDRLNNAGDRGGTVGKNGTKTSKV